MAGGRPGGRRGLVRVTVRSRFWLAGARRSRAAAGEGEHELRALSGHRVHLDRSRMLLDELPGDGQPESGAVGLRGEERLEHAPGLLLVHPRTVVLDADPHIAP